MLSKSRLNLRWLKLGVGSLLFVFALLVLNGPVTTAASPLLQVTSTTFFATNTPDPVDMTNAAYFQMTQNAAATQTAYLYTPTNSATPTSAQTSSSTSTPTVTPTATPTEPDPDTPTATETETPTATATPTAELHLLKPRDGKIMQSSSPILSWTPLPGIDSYYVNVSADPAFTFYATYVASDIQPYQQSDPLLPGVYYWRVRYFDPVTFELVSSEVRSFTIHFNAKAALSQCPATSTNNYDSFPVEQYDYDDPVRPAADNADKNILLRGISWVDEPRELVDYYGPPTDGAMNDFKPPQLATLFSPPRVPTIVDNYRINDWYFAPSPDPGYGLDLLTNVAVHVISVDPGGFFVPLQAPNHRRTLGPQIGHGAMVLYADESSVTLKFTREDSTQTGYTLHIMGICTDPNLLALYRFLDNADRNSIFGSSGNFPQDGVFDYSLPAVKQGQSFGTSYYNAPIFISIRDMGTFLDPRARFDWWQIAPGPGN